jgi:FAD:protein FMN transferase
MARFYSKNICFLCCLWICSYACQPNLTYRQIDGNTMGTYFKVTYRGSIPEHILIFQLDSILYELNMEVSTYIDSSLISVFNQSQNGIWLDTLKYHFFWENYKIAKQIHEQSNGAFDPTIMPLVNYWGFGFQGRNTLFNPDSSHIDSLLKLIGMQHIQITHESKDSLFLSKSQPGIQLDFSAVAKGYGVDVLGLWLENSGIQDYLIDIGGEMRAKGNNPNGQLWTIGISEPLENSPYHRVYSSIMLTNKGLATSGNYRNFYEVDGQKYSHTIHPATGYPERKNLLSATVVAPECAIADAWATSFMVMGLELSIEMAKKNPDIEAYFIFNDGQDSLKSIHIKK